MPHFEFFQRASAICFCDSVFLSYSSVPYFDGWLNQHRTRATQALRKVILNHGQVTRETPELAPNATL